MERSTTYLTYKGSISEAIIEAQKQKKLFLIFISGEDESSTNLENSTWLDVRVAEAVSRYCIFLHLIQGRIEALQFSTIYPQKSVPSMSAVGNNGVMLWQHEGYINAESFVESIERAWAAMHLQDTAAALLSAKLASNKPEPTTYRSTAVTSIEQGESSNLHDPTSLVDNLALNSEDDHKALVEQEVTALRAIGVNIGEDGNPLQSDTANAEHVYMEENEYKENETTEILHSVTQNIPNFQDVPQENCSNENYINSSTEAEGTIHLSSPGSSQINVNDTHEATCSVPNGMMDGENTIKSTTMYLSIRMPSGASLQKKFIVTDRLRSVKNYVDDSHDISLGSYDLAIPYPRKVFNEEDMSKALSELGFASRQALIVIPRSQVPGHQRGLSSSNDIHTAANQTTTNDNAIGYFGYLKRALSYMNPFSYLGGSGGSSSYEQAPNDDLWQYRPNPGAENSSSNPENSNVGRQGWRRNLGAFGSNIHTLRHDEDDFSSRDRNTFWNGNSTQFGGNE